MKNPKGKFVLLTLLGIGILSVGLIGTVYAMTSHRDTNAGNTNAGKPAFIFDALQASGWYSSGNQKHYVGEYTQPLAKGDVHPVSSIAVNQGTKQTPGNCFVDYYYVDEPIDLTSVLKDREERTISNSDGLSLNPLAIKTMQMQTPNGEISYELHQYEVVGNESDQRARGAEFGYVDLKESYIEILGYCKQANQLADSVPILLSVSLKH